MAMNGIYKLQDYAFSRFEDLVELRLAHNQLKTFPPNVFKGIKTLKILDLRNNMFKKIPVAAFKTLTKLQHLYLDNNYLSEVPPDSFDKMVSLVRLWLNANLFTECPTASLSRIKTLRVLDLDSNQIKVLHNYAFKNLTRLNILSMYNNSLEKIEDGAFEGLKSLELLDLNMNRLTKIPYALYSMPQLKELTFDNNRIEYIQDNAFAGNRKLTTILFGENPILSFGKMAFTNLPNLEEIKIHEARDQMTFPDLTGCGNLHTIIFDRANIRSIPYDLCDNVPMLKVLDVHSNQVSKIPDLSGCTHLTQLNLGNNHINNLASEPFSGLHYMQDLILTHNDISLLPADAFKGLKSLQYLDLSNNKISHIDEKAFAPCSALEDLNLGDNLFPTLPTEGLGKLTNLKTYNNKELREIPPPETFPKIQWLTLSYAYHCCDFLSDVDPEAENNNLGIIEEVIWLNSGYDPSLFHNDTQEIWDPLANLSHANYHEIQQHIWDNFATGKEIKLPGVDGGEIPTYTSDFLQEYQKPYSDTHDLIVSKPAVKCKPMPGPFMPCDDLMGWWALRCGVWIVFLFALLGNGCVLFVLISSRTKMDVPRFLICNLAVADFLMGIYLGFLAVVDASTLGEFKKHAIRWQMSPGCLVAGFLGVLSSELSVFTLTVITLERFYAITHAMHLNKRLSIRHAGYIMMCGWCFALLIASMPLFGVSDYRTFAVCLPFEVGDNVSLGYVCFIMFCNMIAFIIIVSCYMKMYCSVRGSQAWNSNDSRVAKRMALLVFTDFACWAPISFFAIASAFGLNLISLNDAKIFTIFILPLNSCANPFLYAIFTKQFKKDCVIICNRIEESSVARHFTRMNQRSSAGNSWGSSHRPSAMNSFMEVQRHSYNYSNSHSGVANSNSDDGIPSQACIVVHNDLAGASREESSESSKSGGSFPRKLRLTLRGPKKSRTKRLKKQNNKERRNSYTAPVPNYKMESSLEMSNTSASSLLLSILQNQLTQTQSEPSNTDSEGDLRTEAKMTGRGRHRDRNRFPHFHNDDKRKRSSKSSPGCWSRRFQGSFGSGGKKTNQSNASLRAKKCRSSRLSHTTSGTSCEISSPLPSSSQSSSDNNNHEYVNITEEMISHLRDVSNSRPNLPDGNPSAELGNHGNYLQMCEVTSERKSDEEMEACNYVVFDPPLHPAAISPEQKQENQSYMQMSSPSFEYVPMVALTSGCSHHSKERGRTQEQRPRKPTPETSPASLHNIPTITRPPPTCQKSDDTNFYMDGASSCGEGNCPCHNARPQHIPSNSSPTLTNHKLSFSSPIATSKSQCIELHSPDVMTSSTSINSPRGGLSSNSRLNHQDSACDTYYESIRDSSSSANSRGSCSTNASNLTTVSLDSGGDYHHVNGDTKETDAFLPVQQVEQSSVPLAGSHAPLLDDGSQRRFPFSMSAESGFNSEETVV
ncbi:leucine-rich repeat-containing G-protein coupled receptor 5-like [Lineus longissimus]|uniref:leucine-rich repeat-containing G-protein coupled receptor 5-like n=1 Tax=Lineus longissimus TaxID=88925 RepID=UPI00315D3770